MSEEPPSENKIRALTIADQPVIYEFLKNFFFTSEPLNEALEREGIPRQFSLERCPLHYLSEGLSLACFTSSGEIIGLILNSKMDIHLNKCRNQDHGDPYAIKISQLLGHFDKQITLSRKLDDNNKQMDVKMITVSDKWRNKGIGKKLLKETIEVAKLNAFSSLRSICTSAYSTKTFLGCGFKVVYCLPYEDLKNDGKIDFLPGKPHTHIAGMVLDL